MFLYASKHNNLLSAASDDWREILEDAIANPRPIQLRDYQVGAVASVRSEWAKGKDTLAVLSTGLGKTELALGVLQAEQDDGLLSRALFLAHRQELIFQPVERVLRGWERLPQVGVCMGNYNIPDAPIVVATVQTLSSNRRLEDCLAYGAFSHLIIDEAHRAASASYIDLIATLKEANPHIKVLGITATPKRTDGKGLKKIFNSVAVKIGIKEAVKMGALVPFVAMAVELDVSLKSVAENANGWNDDALGDVMSSPSALATVVSTWKEQALDRPTIAFTASVSQAYKLAEAFQEAGVKAAALDGTTKGKVRRALIDDYKAGKIQVLVNCAIFIEGFDAPATSCIINCKPTKSDLIYIQAVGRGLRLHPTKTDALILDFCPYDARNMMLAGDLLGRPRDVTKSHSKAKELGVVLDIFAVNVDGDVSDEPDAVVLRVMDLLSSSRHRKRAWTFDGGIASLSIGKKQIIAIVAPQQERLKVADALKAQGKWRSAWDDEYNRISQYHLYQIENNKAARFLVSCRNEQTALEMADEYAIENGEQWAMNRNRKFKKDAPTLATIEYAQRLGVWEEGMDKGRVSQVISHAVALKVLKRTGAIK